MTAREHQRQERIAAEPARIAKVLRKRDRCRIDPDCMEHGGGSAGGS